PPTPLRSTLPLHDALPISTPRASPLRELRELPPLRVTLLQKRVFPFLRFVGQVIQQRRIACEFLDARLAVEFCVEGRLQHADRERTLLDNLLRPFDRGVFQRFERNDLVDQSHVKRLLRIVLIAQVPDLPCFLLSHNAGPVRRAKPAVEATPPRSGLAEARGLG